MWFFPAIMLPITAVVIGTIYDYNQPKKINSFYGYRTAISMKNDATWAFANRLAASSLLYSQVVVLMIIVFISFLGKEGIITLFGKITSFYIIAITLSSITSLIPIVIVEYALTKKFNKDGTKKS